MGTENCLAGHYIGLSGIDKAGGKSRTRINLIGPQMAVDFNILLNFFLLSSSTCIHIKEKCHD